MAFIQCAFTSRTLNMKTNMNVILPYGGYGCENRDKPAAVLYLLHGITDDHSVWMRYTGIERYVRGKNIAVIMPTVQNGFYTYTKTGYDYLKFCGEEVVDAAVKMFGLSAGREDTYVAGVSMGGYGAFRLAFEYPQQFSYAASLSGALDIVQICRMGRAAREVNDMMVRDVVNAFGEEGVQSGGREDLLALAAKVSENAAKKPVLRQYCGTSDYLYTVNNDAKKVFERLGFDYRYYEGEGNHEWGFWDKCIQSVLEEIIHMRGL